MRRDEDLWRELLATFAAEADERLQAINRHLLSLERAEAGTEGGRLLQEIFREAHSLKGAARAVNAERVEAVAHCLESLFGKIQSGELTPDATTYDLAYRAADAMEALVRESTAGEATDVDVRGLTDALDAATNGGHGQSAPAGRTSADNDARPAAETTPTDAPIAPPGRPDPADVRPVEARNGDPAGAGPGAEDVRGEEVVRVAVSKLDSLMAQVGELLVTAIGVDQSGRDLRALGEAVDEWEASWKKVRPAYRRLLAPETDETNGSHRPEQAAVVEFLDASETRLRAIRSRIADLTRRFEADTHRMNQVTAELEEDVRRTRMFPIATIFGAFPRMVRDIGRASGKEVNLVVSGDETEVDRAVLDEIRAPVTHLLRNCIDHGLETPGDRRAAGKPAEGTINLSASQRGDSLVLDIFDDGAGIDVSRVRATAARKGFLSTDEADAMSGRDVLDLIFRPGFSTSPIITDLSGRGVGLDVVRETVERLHGVIALETTEGHGTRFTLTLPLTVATTRCLLVECGSQPFALSTTNVLRIVRVAPQDVRRAEGRDAVVVDGQPVGLISLGDLLGSGPAPDADGRSKRPAVIIGSGERRVACAVESLLGVQDIVMKTLPPPLYRVRHIAGATILGTGEVVCVLNPSDVLRSAEAARPRAEQRRDADARPKRSGPALVLLAEDSITTRTLEQNILEAAGFEVRACADGADAWALLQSGEEFDIVVSDIQMPRMDGFELTSRIRGDDRVSRLPVVLVTALSSVEDERRGIEAGADAYIRKGSFDQDGLLETIRRLI